MKYTFLLLLLFIGIGVSPTQAQPQKLYFDPGSASGVPQSRIFDEITYIPLETKRESLFGRISRLIVTDTYFVVYDTDTKAIYFFLKDGKFEKKFKFRRYDIKSIVYDESRDALLITGLNKNYSPSQKNIQDMIDDPVHNNSIKYTRAIYYYLSGKNQWQSEIIKDFDMALANPFIFNTDYWVYSYIYANRSWPDATDHELKISDGNRIARVYFPYNRKSSSIFYGDPKTISFSRSGRKDELFFTRPFRYGIYQLNADTVNEVYTVVLPAGSTIPQSFYNENFSSRAALEDFKLKNSGVAWGVGNVIDFDRYLYFSLDYFRNWRGRNFIFDKKTMQFYNQNRVTADSTNHYLPVLGYTIQAHDHQHLYSSVSSAAMFQNKKSNEKRSPEYDPVLTKYFQNRNSEDNPVIIVLKPKAK